MNARDSRGRSGECLPDNPAAGLRLRLDGVSQIYQAGTPFAAEALQDVTLTVEPGDRLAIAGPVGSGKSTLLSILSGVEPAAAGRVWHGEKEITRRHPPAPGSIGLAFQSPENCLFEKSVFDDVAFAPRRQGLSDEALRRRVDFALTTVGLEMETFGPRNPFSLSMGEQRRVALAGVLAMKPRALLLDEPTAHLDPATRRELIDRLRRLNEESGVTLVMVGHDMDELARFASRVVIIDGWAQSSRRRGECDPDRYGAPGKTQPRCSRNRGAMCSPVRGGRFTGGAGA